MSRSAARGRTAIAAVALLAAFAGIAFYAPRRAEPTKAPLRGSQEPSALRVPALSQGAQGAQSAVPLSGTVRTLAGAPLAGAQVCARRAERGWSQPGAPIACVATDTSGLYRVAALTPGIYRVVASARGFEPAEPTTASASEHDGIQVDATPRRADFALRPGGASVQGVVVDIGGGPVAGALVQAIESDERLRAVLATRSDEQGRFELFTRASALDLRAEADGYASARKPVAAPAEAIEIALTPASMLIATVVRAADQTPVAGVRVSANKIAPWLPAPGDGFAISGARGEVSIAVSAGSYGLTAASPGWVGRAPAKVVVDVAERSQPTTIEVRPAVSVRGRVVIEPDARPCASASVSLSPSGARSIGDGALAVADGDGYVRFEALAPGAYSAHVNCPGYLAAENLAPVQLDATDVDGLSWAVHAGHRIRGRVVDTAGAGVAGKKVLAAPADGATRTTGEARSGDRGEFEIDGLMPGSYALTCGEAAESALRVTLGADQEHEPVTIVAAASAGIRVQVRAPADVRLDALTVSAKGPALQRVAHARGDGRFELADLPPGHYEVVVYDGRNPPLRAEAEARASTTTELAFELHGHDGVIRGQVVDERGGPVADAWVSVEPSGFDDPFELAATAVLSGAEGAFELRGLAPGSYDVKAFRAAAGSAVRSDVRVGTSVTIVLPTPDGPSAAAPR